MPTTYVAQIIDRSATRTIWVGDWDDHIHELLLYLIGTGDINRPGLYIVTAPLDTGLGPILNAHLFTIDETMRPQLGLSSPVVNLSHWPPRHV